MQKQCRGCLVTLPITGFYRHSQMADGYLNFCKECVRRRVTENRENNLEAIRAYDRKRGRSPEHRARVREYNQRNRDIVRRAKKDWEDRNPHKKKAATAVSNAKRDGKLLRQPCEVCGFMWAEAHHDDYTKPLEVRWLCDPHHKEHHNRMREMERAA